MKSLIAALASLALACCALFALPATGSDGMSKANVTASTAAPMAPAIYAGCTSAVTKVAAGFELISHSPKRGTLASAIFIVGGQRRFVGEVGGWPCTSGSV